MTSKIMMMMLLVGVVSTGCATTRYHVGSSSPAPSWTSLPSGKVMDDKSIVTIHVAVPAIDEDECDVQARHLLCTHMDWYVLESSSHTEGYDEDGVYAKTTREEMDCHQGIIYDRPVRVAWWQEEWGTTPYHCLVQYTKE